MRVAIFLANHLAYSMWPVMVLASIAWQSWAWVASNRRPGLAIG